MNFSDALRAGWQIVRLDRSTYRSVAKDPESFAWALLFAAVAGFASGLDPQQVSHFGFLWRPVKSVLTLLVGAWVLHFLSGFLGGRGDFMGLVRILGLGELTGWVAFVPVIGFLAQLWFLVVVFMALREHEGLTDGKAIAVMVIPAVLFMVAALILGASMAALILAF
jgi:hypothetical protein